MRNILDQWKLRRGVSQRPISSIHISTLRALVIVALFTGFFNIMQLAVPLFSMQVFDRVIPAGHLATLASLVLVMIGLNCCSLIVDAARGVLMSRIASRLDSILHRESAYREFQQADAETSSLPDVALIRNFIAGPLAAAVIDAPWSIIYLIAIFALHWVLGWLTMAVIFIVVVWAGLGHALTHKRRLLALTWGSTEHAILQSVRADSHVIQAMGSTHSFLKRFIDAHKTALHFTSVAESRQAWVDAGARALRNIFQVAVLTVAALLAVDQQVQVGTIIASSMLFSRAIAPIERLSVSLPAIAAVYAAIRRIRKLLSNKDLQRSSLSLPKILGALTVENIVVLAPNQPEPVLHDVSFSVEAGAVLIIVGQEGAGKSTLARVLCGAIRPDRGQVRIDGSHLLDFDVSELGPQIGFLPEAVRFEPGTVASIIARGGVPNDTWVIEAARLAGAHDVIQRLPRGYQTIVRPNDYGLSAGQKQRIALARALYGNPAFVVLDEPTAHLDDAGEALLVRIVEELRKKGTTMVIVSRSPTLVHLADHFIMLAHGRVELNTDRSKVNKFLSLKLAAVQAV